MELIEGGMTIGGEQMNLSEGDDSYVLKIAGWDSGGIG